jgi:glucosamine-6-phosphate deaminase
MLDLDVSNLQEWLSIPVTDLASRSPIAITVIPSVDEVHQHLAQTMFDEFAAAADRGEEVSVIVAIGPKEHFPLLAELVNRAGLSLNHVTFFGMDEWLDWQGRPVDWDHPCRLEAYFHRHFVDLLKSDYRPRPENVIFPSPYQLDRPAEEMRKRGQPSTTYAGFGFQGHVAFNEPPSSRWTPVTLDQLRESTTRVVAIQPDSIIAHAVRSLGGNVIGIPPMAITLGMRELLSAKRLRLYSVTGPWKQTILRILLFSRPSVDFPVTLVHDHPDVHVTVDEVTAACPPTAW